MKNIWVISVFFMFFTDVSAQVPVHLAGKVMNQAYTPLQDYLLTVKEANLTAVTDKEGRFNISSSVVSVHEGDNIHHSAPRITDSRLIFDVLSGAQEIGIDIYDIKGTRINSVVHKNLPQGTHRIPLFSDHTRMPATSVFFVVLTQGAQKTRFKVINLDQRRCSLSGILRENSGGMAKKSIDLQSPDTIVITKKGGNEVFSVEISSYDNTNILILLDLLPTRILEIAVAEENRYPDEVGKELDFYPYDLERYLQRISPEPHDLEAWCSEFVSWCYVAAGFPLTGGRTQEWMLKGSTQLRSWFQDNADFVNREHPDWDTFVPAPGDYIRYDNSSGGHSGIVRYAEGTTLYTVEGNVGNRVRLRTLTQWKNITSVDGIGRRSGMIAGGAIIEEMPLTKQPAHVYPDAGPNEG